MKNKNLETFIEKATENITEVYIKRFPEELKNK